jgi:hypothetical protein
MFGPIIKPQQACVGGTTPALATFTVDLYGYL